VKIEDMRPYISALEWVCEVLHGESFTFQQANKIAATTSWIRQATADCDTVEMLPVSRLAHCCEELMLSSMARNADVDEVLKGNLPADLQAWRSAVDELAALYGNET
jgi:hypothetical protein